MDRAAAFERLRDYVRQAGTQVAAARALKVSPQYLNDVLNGRRDPARVLERIGLRRVVTYEEQP